MLNADDRTLIASLSEIADFQRKTGSAWSYSGDAGRTAAHGLIQYPAMMVPAMQRDILASMVRAAPKARTVLDPFVGSGTALTETLAASRSFVGYDINPLAILIAKVKASPIHAGMYADAAEQVLARIEVSKPIISVFDNGIGVKTEIEDRIFGMFVSDKPKETGRGLGLFITREILLRYGCDVTLSDARNAHGRRYRFDIDLAAVTQ